MGPKLLITLGKMKWSALGSRRNMVGCAMVRGPFFISRLGYRTSIRQSDRASAPEATDRPIRASVSVAMETILADAPMVSPGRSSMP